MPGLEIHKTLVLSTAHLRSSTCQALEAAELESWVVAGGKTDRGFYIYAHDEIPEGVQPELAVCLTFARQHGCEYVHFDADASDIDQLPTFGWGADEPKVAAA